MSLIRAIVELFGGNFVRDPVLIHTSSARGNSRPRSAGLQMLDVAVDAKDKVPDVVLFDRERNRLFLVEASTSHGTVGERRRSELSEMFSASSATLVLVSAFRTRAEMSRHSDEIAWETVAWMADDPAHLIHFNGGRLLGPRPVL